MSGCEPALPPPPLPPPLPLPPPPPPPQATSVASANTDALRIRVLGMVSPQFCLCGPLQSPKIPEPRINSTPRTIPHPAEDSLTRRRRPGVAAAQLGRGLSKVLYGP